eukprot:s751_g13.t1
MGYIYHERQLGGLCGVHCLNNLLQGPAFGPGDLAEIGVHLDQQERALVRSQSSQSQGGVGLEGQPYNVDSSADGGNFSIQVLTVALERYHLELVPSRHPDVKEKIQDPASATQAFLCQYHDHWLAVEVTFGRADAEVVIELANLTILMPLLFRSAHDMCVAIRYGAWRTTLLSVVGAPGRKLRAALSTVLTHLLPDAARLSCCKLSS